MEDMPVNLSQLLDLAISSDIASVNFLHLRNVLSTIIKTLDIGGTVVHQRIQEDAETVEVLYVNKSEQDEATPLSDSHDNGREKRGTPTGGNGNQTVTEREETPNDDTDTNDIHSTVEKGDGKREEDNNLQRQSGLPKTIKEPERRARNESADSKVSNFTVSRNSGLSIKIIALEEGLQRLRTIVEDLVSRGNFEGNLSDSLIDQLKEDEKDIEKVDTISVDEYSNSGKNLPRKRTSSGRTSRAWRGSSRPVTREIAGKSNLKRPVTQPVPQKIDGAEKPAQLTRSKTENALSDGKLFSRKASVLEKLKQRRRAVRVNEKDSLAETESCENNEDDKDTQDKEIMVQKNEEVTGVHKTLDREVTDKVVDDESKTSAESSGESQDDVESEGDLERMIENEIEAALNDPDDPLNDPDDPAGAVYAVHFGLEQMQNWREEFAAVQDQFRSDVMVCKNSIQKLMDNVHAFSMARKAQAAEQFNAINDVHTLIIGLDEKQSKLRKTVNDLVDEFNRHDNAFHDVFDKLEKIDEQKVDKVLLSTQVSSKANKDDLRDKVSLSTFDETFCLLDRGLSDALERMANQMSMEEALRETLNEMQSGMDLKLDRDELDRLRGELEARIKEVRDKQQKGREGKTETPGDPAGFKRKTEKVRCISCDRDMQIEVPQVQGPVSIPKAQSFFVPQVNKTASSREGNMTKKIANDEYRLSKIKSEMVQNTGLLDFTTLPMSQRFCGGRHTIINTKQRSLATSHFNDYIVIRDEAESFVTLPSRDYIVSRDSGISRLLSQKLPAINEVKPVPDKQKEVNFFKSGCDNIDFLPKLNEKAKRSEK